MIRKWLVMRMAALEFGFKRPFEINEEYKIMKSILFFTLVPVELLFIFTCARLYGSLSNYRWQLIIIISFINILVSNLMINGIKNDISIKDAISQYEQKDYDERRKYYSFKNVAGIISLMLLVPWSVLFIGIIIVCMLIPR